MLPLYNHILVPTDFSANADQAFRHAVLLARLHDAKIHLVHVIQQVDPSMRNFVSSVIGADRLAEYETNNLNLARSELKNQLDAFIRRELEKTPQDQKHFAEAIVTMGHPVEKILAEAQRLAADVIVMGTHGRGMLEHALLGSVTEKILRKARRPVFVVPLPDR